MTQRLMAGWILAWMMTACSPASLTPSPAGQEVMPLASPTLARAPTASGVEAESPATPMGPPGLATVTTSEPPIVGAVPPELQAKIEADLEARTGVSAAMFTLIRAEAVTWNDGSLGCPEPGMFYTQALEDGYWIVWQVGAEQYDYRATQRGTFMLCALRQPSSLDQLPPTSVIQLPNSQAVSTEAPVTP